MLRRSLGLWQTVLLGIGIMIGAGIYVLVGVAGAQAGDALWLSFLIGAILAILTGFTYAELTSMFPNAGSSYFYSKQAFGSRRLSFLLGWFLIIAYTAMSATVAFGFAQYLNTFFDVPQPAVAFGVIVVLGILNYIGLREASGFNTIATVLEIAGLVGILALFFWSAGFSDFEFSTQSPTGLGGLLSAVVFVFFAYLGFEVLPTISEEVKDVRRTLPKALLISIAITSALYILVAIAFTSALTHVEIVSAVESGKGALAVAAGKFGGNAALLALGIVALFSTANTILISTIGVSRMMYGMAKEKALPGQLLSTTRSGVPGNSIIISTALSVLFVLVGDIEFIARISVAGLLMTFIIDNLSVIYLRLKKSGLERPFRIPFSIGRIPLFPALAIVSMGLLLVHEFWVGPALLLGFAGLVIAGIALNEAEYRLTGD